MDYKPTRFMLESSHYDKDAADYAVAFIEQLCHTKGKWAGQKFKLLPWQEQIVRDLFGTLKQDGNRQFMTAYVESVKKSGKMLALYTLIPTPDGFTTMGDIRVGDTVFSETGLPCRVVAKSPVDYEEQAYRITFRDGQVIEAGEHHQWLGEYTYVKNRKQTIMTTGELYRMPHKEGDGNVYRFRISVADAICCEEADLPIEPYLMGYWLGNGTAQSAEITIQTCDVENVMANVLPYHAEKSRKQNVGDSIRVKIPDLKKVLVNSFHDKRIPMEYMRASREQRLRLLQGLMDSDGTVNGRKGQAMYTSAEKPLAEDVSSLLWSLGIKNAIETEDSTQRTDWGLPSRVCGRVRTGETIYNVKFTLFSDVHGCGLERKQCRAIKRNPRTRSHFRYIDSIVPIKNRGMQCIQVDSPSHQYLVGRSFLPTHNSELAAAIALFLLFADGEPSAEVYGAAADRQQASIVFDVASQMVQMSPALSRRSKILTANKRIHNYDNNGYYQVLSAEVGCVVPETEMLMADGTVRSADEIQAGDELLAFDETDCVTDTVASVREEEPSEVLEVFAETGDSVCVTRGHPFWCLRDGVLDWIPAEELSSGDLLTLVGNEGDLYPVRFDRAEERGLQETISIEMRTLQTHVTNGFITHNTKHGFNVSGLVLDEVHVQPNRKLYDVLTKGSGDAREQPLYFLITTAGTDTNSICYELHQKAVDILEGRKVDPTFYPVIYAADPDDDWTDPEVWKKANPSLGITVSIEKMRAACESAQQNPAEENSFRQLRLNQWVKQSVRWMPMTRWDACAFPVDGDELAGRVCYGGLDLSQTTDITAFVLVFPPRDEDGKYVILPYFWIPEENVPLRVNRDHVPYDIWERQGYLQTTEGNVVHYAYIEKFIESLGERFNIREIAFDRWGAVQMVQNLEEMGFTVVPFGQGFKDMSPPTKELMKLVLEGRIAHGGHPVLRWMMDNIFIRTDPAGNIKMDKEKSTEKIDGAVATVMALDRAIRCGPDTGDSIYDHRPLLFI